MGSIHAYIYTCIYNHMCICILMLWVNGWGEVHGEVWDDNLKRKTTFAEIREHGLKQGTRGRTALQAPELSQTICTVEWSHKGSGLVGMEMLCCGKSCKCTYLTHGYSPQPGTGAIYCSYFRYNFCWLSWLSMTWESNGNWFTHHLGQWSVLLQEQTQSTRSLLVLFVFVWVFLPVLICVASHVCVHVDVFVCVPTENTCAGSSLSGAGAMELISAALPDLNTSNDQEILYWNAFAFAFFFFF